MIDASKCIKDAEVKMKDAVAYLADTLAHVRAGKANVSLLDGIMVESYGAMMPIDQVSAISTPDARSIVIRPWDKNTFKPIETAIINSNLGIMPENNGEVIRLGIPPLTEERRRDLTKQCKAETEDAKQSIRQARQEARDLLKKAVKEEDMSEDLQRKSEDKVQELHDKYIKALDKTYADKEKEIMTI